MSLSQATVDEITGLLKSNIVAKINNYSLDEEDSAKPFQYALLTEEGYLSKSFIHGLETSLGSWYETIAEIIAHENFKAVAKLKGTSKLTGQITNNAIQKIESILNDLDMRTQKPNNDKETEDIFAVAQSGNSGQREQTVDLYLEHFDGREVYFEIKGPKPNKNEMKAARHDLLDIYAMRAFAGKNVNVFLGMYYNSYYPNQYKRWTALRFFELEKNFLVGETFWDYLGGNGTYNQLIQIFEDVGTEIRPKLEHKINSLSVKDKPRLL